MRTIHIGRNASNDIVYNEPSVSGSHADLTIGDDGQMIITDHSTNGTYVNGQPLRQSSQPVSFGDSVVFPGGLQLDWNQVAAMVQPSAPPQMPQMQQMPPVPPMPPQQQYSMDMDMDANAGYTSGGGNYSISYGGNDGGIGGGGSLSFNQTFADAWESGKRNVLPLFLTILLAGLTSWIPYLGFGVIIAMMTIAREWAKGTTFSPLSIFDRKYRERMSDYVMYIPFCCISIFISMFCIPIAGPYVLSIGWMLAPLFLLNKETSFIEAIRNSWRTTYGHKWLIFGIVVVYALVAAIVLGLSFGLMALISGALFESSLGAAIAVSIILGLLVFAVYLLILSIGIGITGSIWKQLVGNIEE